MLYSYQGQEPSALPYRIRLDNGETRTSLNELSDLELNSIGFSGPFTKPNFDPNTEKLEWDGNEYSVITLTEEEKIKIQDSENERRKREVNFNLFWDYLINSKFYKKIRSFSVESIKANTICTEFLALLTDAKFGIPNLSKIQEYLNIILVSVSFSEEDYIEIYDIFDKSNLKYVLTIPDTKYISSGFYDFDNDVLVGPKPHDSWTLVNGTWESPVPYPADGFIYEWDESNLNWFKVST